MTTANIHPRGRSASRHPVDEVLPAGKLVVAQLVARTASGACWPALERRHDAHVIERREVEH